MADQIMIDVSGAVLIARIGNPPAGYMDADTETELAALLNRVETDDAVRAVVLTGSLPDVFIRHYDVGVLEKTSRAMAERGMTFSLDRLVPETLYLTCLRRIEEMPKPFVAAINGTAMGGGFELTLACDIRLARQGDFSLGLPEINVGLLPGAGGTQRLARLIGEARALEMIMLGRTVSPDEALDLGIVSACVDGDVVAAALKYARELATKPPKALSHIKQLIRGSTGRPLADGLADERTLFCDLMVNPQTIELMTEMNNGTRGIQDRDPGEDQ